MCYFDWSLEILEVGSLVARYKFVDLSAPCNVVDARGAYYNPRENRKAMFLDTLG